MLRDVTKAIHAYLLECRHSLALSLRSSILTLFYTILPDAWWIDRTALLISRLSSAGGGGATWV
jgi:hypothetical protein